MSSAEDILPSLEICAERCGDIVPDVYQRFFALDKGAAELMAHSDDHMRGRMFEQTLELLMSDQHFGEDGYLNWELDNHLMAYQVNKEMYTAFFQAIIEVVREGAGEHWKPADAQAWQDRVNYILDFVYRHPAVQT